ncbi:MAG: hypothetical protein WAR22_12900 [Desulfomonilia bacterium]|jgi:hypothetical protein
MSLSNPPGKKAELDKEGISFGIDKAQLDKEGIPLDEAPADREAPGGEAPAEQAVKRAWKVPGLERKALVICLILGIATACLATVFFVVRSPQAPGIEPAALPVDPPGPAFSPIESELVLDPFMVLTDPREAGESGVLIAQVSLQVISGEMPNVMGRLFEIRDLIYRRLSANVDIYEKNEIAAMILDDLKNLKIRDVAFIQYENR